MIWTVLKSTTIDAGAGIGPRGNTVQKSKREVLDPSEVFEAIKLEAGRTARLAAFHRTRRCCTERVERPDEKRRVTLATSHSHSCRMSRCRKTNDKIENGSFQ